MGLLCDKTFLVQMQYTHLLTSGVEPMTSQSMDITTAQLGEPLNFIGVTDRKMGEELLKEEK